jgi:PIN domain nuclease of toxin-antitoxin system
VAPKTREAVGSGAAVRGIRGVLSDKLNALLFSVASVWEIVIKVQSGRLRLSEDDAANYIRTVRIIKTL